MPVILALDQGTTSSRAIVFDHDGQPLATARQEFTQHFPRPGWVEHDAQEIWQSQRGVAEQAMGEAGLRASDIAAIGITNQRETTVAWDRRSGKPIANAIVWQDRRTADWCAALRDAGHETLIQRKTGLVIDAYFSGSKMRWMLDHVEDARELAEAGHLAMGTIDSWLAYRLTGGGRSQDAIHVTDPTNASRTSLFNLERGDWDDELLALFGVPRAALARIVPTSGIIGEVAEGALKGVPVAALVGDQQAALFGQRCVSPGMVKNTYGTGCFLLMDTGTQRKSSRHRLLATAAASAAGTPTFALEGSVFIGGAVVQWLRDGLHLVDSASEVEALAKSVGDSGDVYLVPAFTGLGAPHWDASARGTLVGLTRGTTAGHIARAALEAIAFQVADVLDAMHADAGKSITELRVDGGAARNDLLMQFQADVLGVPVVRPRVTETTALGAAYLAGLAVGFWRDGDALDHLWKEERRFEPRMSRTDAEAKRHRWGDALKRARGWVERSE